MGLRVGKETMEKFLRYSSGVKRSADIDSWLDERPGPLGNLARNWFAKMRNCGDDVLELLHDGCPVACVRDIPFAYVNVFTAHMNVGFYLGAFLDDPQHLLVGTGKRMRHVKLRPETAIEVPALEILLVQAYSEAKVRLST